MPEKSKDFDEVPKERSNLEFKIPPGLLNEIRPPIKLSATRRKWKALPIKEGLIKNLVKKYAEVLERGRTLGRSVNVRVKVGLGQPPKITSVIVEPKAKTKKSGEDHLQRALAAARERGQLRVAEILKGDDMLSADAFAAVLRTTRMTINSKRQKHQVLALEGATRGFRFPQWQIGYDGKPFSALPALFERLGNDSWAVYRFLVQHHPELDGLTGREALQRGMTSEAIGAAESVARNAA